MPPGAPAVLLQELRFEVVVLEAEAPAPDPYGVQTSAQTARPTAWPYGARSNETSSKPAASSSVFSWASVK